MGLPQEEIAMLWYNLPALHWPDRALGDGPYLNSLLTKQVLGSKGGLSGTLVPDHVGNEHSSELGTEKDWEPVEFLQNMSNLTISIGFHQQLSCGILHIAVFMSFSKAAHVHVIIVKPRCDQGMGNVF